jgi:hypothetical protein
MPHRITSPGVCGFCEIVCISRYVAPVKEIRKYAEFLLLKFADRSFVTINREWKHSIENYYNAFAAVQFHSVNYAHLHYCHTSI